MKNASSMSKDSSNISKSCFSCYFCCSLVNFKNLIILFWNIWVIYGSWKSWRGVMFDLEHIKKDLYFVIPNWLIWSLLRGGWRGSHYAWYLWWGVFTSIATSTNSQNSQAAAESPSLKISSPWHLSNDYKDCPKQPKNSNKLCNDTFLSLMRSQWKPRKQHDKNFPMEGKSFYNKY